VLPLAELDAQGNGSLRVPPRRLSAVKVQNCESAYVKARAAGSGPLTLTYCVQGHPA